MLAKRLGLFSSIPLSYKNHILMIIVFKLHGFGHGAKSFSEAHFLLETGR